MSAVASSGCSYNTFVGQEEAIKTQWAQVENQLQRRNDLIPNLVATVQGVAQQERDVFGAIADSRARLAGATTPEQRMAAANEQSSALARLLVVVENYPDLKSNQTFARLMDELAGTENRLAVERMRYNEAVQAYNTQRRSFPNITAGIFGFKEHPCSRRRNRPAGSRRSISRALPSRAAPQTPGRPRPGATAASNLSRRPPSNLVPVDDVALAASGDTAAFERLYHAHVARVHSLAAAWPPRPG